MVNTLEEIGAISKNHIYEIRYESDLREEKAEGIRAHLGQSMEDYLKTIYVIRRKKMGVRNVQIAEMMGRSKPSVTVSVNALVEKGYVKKKAHGNLCLTSRGMALADKIFDRYVFFQEILKRQA